MKRQVLLVVNPTREEARSGALSLATQLQAREITVFQALSTEGDHIPGIPVRESSASIKDFELVIVLGGDGTILRSAEMVRSSDVPLLGVNLGHVGFLAEIEKNSLGEIADQVAAKNFTVESRMVLSFAHHRGGKVISTGWALNDLVIEKQSPRMIEVFLEIDGRPLSKWGCDGVLCATPTGSTAYAFSAGGPVVWPEVAALVLLPLSAHALFAKPMVVSPNSKIQITLLSEEALLTADGFRSEEIKLGDAISITKDDETVNLARLGSAPFADRLVAKFKLPVEGWRGE
jgi:NAD+ kinase